MAYQADIRISVKGGKQIEQLSKAAELLTPVIEEANQAFKIFGDLQNQNLPLLRNFNRVLQENRKAFNDAVLGTKEATTAAQALVQAERAVNGELERRNTLLNAVRAGGFGPKQADPAQKVAAQKLQAKDEQALQNALLAKEREKQQAFEDSFKLKGQSVNIEKRTKKILQEQLALEQGLLKLEQKSSEKLQQEKTLRNELLTQTKQQVSQKVKQLNLEASKENNLIKARVTETNKLVESELKLNMLRRERMIDANEELLLEVKLNKIKDQAAANELRRQRNQQALSNAIIGGAFPLLFGQGLGASVGGAAGGFVGGKKGGQFGFALSLAGTALGSQLDNLAKKARELGEALREPVKNIDTLVKAIGQSNTPFGDTINTLKRLGLEGVAANAVLDNFNKTFNTNRQTINQLGQESIRLNNEFQKLGTAISLFVAKPLTFLLEKINSALGVQTISDLKREAQAQAVREKRLELGQSNVLGGTKTGNPILDFFKPGIDLFRERKLRDEIDVSARAFEIFEQKMNEAGLGGQAGTKDFANEDLQKLIKDRRDFELSVLKSNLAIEKQSLTTRKEDLEVLKRRIDSQKLQEQITIKNKNLASLQTDEAKAQAQFELDKLIVQKQISDELLRQSIILANPIDAELIKLNNAIRDINDSQLQAVNLSKTMASSFEESFKGIVNGTMSIQDAFRNMLNSIANHFINTAAKMAANQLQRGLLGILGQGIAGAFSSGSSFKNFGSTSVGTAGQFIGSVKGFPTFADGGRPPVGRASIVGERGPELFVPNRSGTIIPNNRLGGGNNTSVVVNVDASGSDVQGDEEQATQFGSAIATAIQSELIRQQRPGGLLSR